MTLQQPFDLQYWFVNVFAGNLDIFLFIFLLGILILAARFRMTVIMVSFIALLGVLIISPFYRDLIPLAMLIVAFIVGWMFSKKIIG